VPSSEEVADLQREQEKDLRIVPEEGEEPEEVPLPV